MSGMDVVLRARNVRSATFGAWSAAYVIVCLAAYVATDAFVTDDGVSVWFPPAALSFAYLLRFGLVGLPIVLATRFVAAVTFMGSNFRLGNMVVTGVLIVGAYTVVAVLVRPRIDQSSSHTQRLAWWVIGGLGAPLTASVGAVAWMVHDTSLTPGRHVDTVGSFWLGDAAAVVTLAPLFAFGSVLARRARTRRWWAGGEVVVQLLSIAVVGWILVAPDLESPQFYVAFGPLVWIAVKYGLASVSLTLAATGTLLPLLRLERGAVADDMAGLQLFLVVYAVTGLVLAAVESDRRNARDELAESERRIRAEHRATQIAERRFRKSFESAPIGIALVGTDGRWLRVNEALCRILGYTQRELSSLTFQDITHPDDLDEDLGLVEQVLADEIEGYTLEKRYFHKSGRVITAQLDVSLVRDDDGAPLHFISQIHDISMRKAMIESLQQAEVTQRACLNALEQGIAMSDMTGTVHLLNPSGRRILGYDAAGLSERFKTGAWETYREDDTPLPEEEQPIGVTMRTGEAVYDQIVRWRRADGEMITLRVATEPVRDEQGNLTGVVTAFADITREREAEKAEKAALDRLEWQAFHDPLTGLANRSLLLEHLRSSLTDRRHGGLTALFFLDLDGFKMVNDTMGHAAGDELLAGVAARLDRAVRAEDIVARFGGDEFVVLAEDLVSLDAAEALAVRITDELAAPISLSTGAVTISASVGVAIAGHNTGADVEPDALLAAADAALYRAKQNRPGRYEMVAGGADRRSG